MTIIQNSVFVLILLLLASCKTDPPVSETTPATATVQTNPMATSGEGSVATPVIPALDVRYVDLLVTDFWVAERWVDHGNRENGERNAGFWWKFNPDGTMFLGHWEEDLSSGVWTATPVQDKVLLHIDAANDAYDMEFEIQGQAINGDYMWWVGTRTYKMSNIAVKAIALLSKPTKKQFGVE